MKKCALFLLSFILTASFAQSQIEVQRGPAQKIKQAIRIDGLLDDPEWNRAPEANEFITAKEQSPENSGFDTVLKILFDENSIYLGMICYDGNPELILSEISEHDSDIRDDDSIYVLVESPRDLENLYIFGANLLGARFDGKITRDISEVDTGWNGNWRTAARKTAFGWTIEMVIELTSLDIKPGENVDLGLKISRMVPRMDSLFRKGLLDPAYDLDNLGNFQRLELIRTFTRTDFQAHVLSNLENKQPAHFAPGLHFRYALTNQTITEIALNPDFITVEPDEERINLRFFELDIPEKRDFFLQDSNSFQQPFRIFHSKRIGDIQWGFRIQGNEGGFKFTGMSVQGKEDHELGFDSANFSTLRLQKTLLPSLRLGLTAANKRRGHSNFGAAGVDAEFRISKFFRIDGQAATSFGDHTSDNLALSLGPKFQNRSLGMHLYYRQIGEKFGDNVNHIGYVPDDNRTGIDAAISQIFSLKSDTLRQIELDSTFERYHGRDGTRRIEMLTAGSRFRFQSEWEIKIRFKNEYRLNENIRGPVLLEEDFSSGRDLPRWVIFKDFMNRYVSIISGMDKNDGSAFSLGFTMGKNFGRIFQMAEFRKQLSLSRRALFDFCFYHISYGENREANFQTTNILLIKGHHDLNPNLRMRSFLQYHSVLNKTTYHFSLEYLHSPSHGSVWLGYQKGTSPFGFPGIQDHSIILKMSYQR